MYPWNHIIPVDKAAATPVYLQIANVIIKEIMAGRITPGQKMPGARQLSDLLGVNRKTIVAAYDELMAQDWLKILPSQGAFISHTLPAVRRQQNGGASSAYHLLAHAAFPLHTPPTETAQDVSYKRQLLRITDGSPDVRLAPMESLYRRCRTIAGSPFQKQYLRYSSQQGEDRLRATLSTYLRQTRGLACSPQQLLITRGSQMGIYLVFEVLLQAGDKVIVGNSSYPVTNEVIRYFGGEVVTVPVDEQGIQVDAVARLCRQHAIRAMYLTPHHHYPTTVTLSAERRVQLLQLAQEYRIAVVEDDYDYDFHYSSSPLLPLVSLDTQGVVIYIGSFTKCIAPAVRTGYMVAPENVVQAFGQHRKIIDRQGDPVLEKALSELIEEGELQRHLKKSLKVYRDRRDYFCELLQRHLGAWTKFRKPDGGMAVWVVFSPDVDLLALHGYAHSRNISLEGVEDWLADHALRLGFASLNEQEMEYGIRVLAEGIQHQRL